MSSYPNSFDNVKIKEEMIVPDLDLEELKESEQYIKEEVDYEDFTEDDYQLECTDSNILRQILQINVKGEQTDVQNKSINKELENDDSGNDRLRSPAKKKFARNKKRNPSAWKKNIRKDRLNRGESYVSSTGKLIPAKTLKPACKEECFYKCSKIFTEERRKEIFKEFYSVDKDEKKSFILANTICSKTKNDNASKKRHRAFKYYLPIETGNWHQVCKVMFQNTLSISGAMVHNVHKKKTSNFTPGPDRRGKHGGFKVSIEERDRIRSHIDSFPRFESRCLNYCHSSTKKEYLDRSLNIERMYNLYKEKYEDGNLCKSSFYRHIFNMEYNLSFAKPNSEKCDVCEEYKIYSKKGSVAPKLKESRTSKTAKGNARKKRKKKNLKDDSNVIEDLNPEELNKSQQYTKEEVDYEENDYQSEHKHPNILGEIVFQNTSSISDEMAHNVKKKTPDFTSTTDRRRKRGGLNVPIEERERIRSHIDSFPRFKSHCSNCRSSTEKEYLDKSLTIERICDLYKEKHKDGNPSFYRFIFNMEYNLGFAKPNTKKCDVCNEYIIYAKRDDATPQLKESHTLKAAKGNARKQRKKDQDLEDDCNIIIGLSPEELNESEQYIKEEVDYEEYEEEDYQFEYKHPNILGEILQINIKEEQTDVQLSERNKSINNEPGMSLLSYSGTENDDSGNDQPESSAKKKFTRNRKRNPSNWKINIRKNKIARGESYISSTGKPMPAKILKPACKEECFYKCTKIFTEEHRKKIFRNFYSIDKDEKRSFILANSVCMKTKNDNASKKRHRAFRYFLPDKKGNLFQVCKVMFQNTLSIGGKMVRNVHMNKTDALIPAPDRRGKHSTLKVSIEERERIRDHIDSFPRIGAHCPNYCNSPTKKGYLDGSLNIEKMYQLYREKHEDGNPCKSSFYRFIFNTEYNLGFVKPNSDRCDVCKEYKIYLKGGRVTPQLQESYSSEKEAEGNVRKKRKKGKDLEVDSNVIVGI